VNLLHIDSSILGDHSVSRKVSAAAVASLVAANPGAKVTYRDLDAAPAPHQSGALMAARGLDPAARSADQARDVADADAVLDEFLAADVVVIGVPMYNFGIPSTLKSWIDHLAVAGKTFRYSEAGPEGLACGKRIILASSRGGRVGSIEAAAPLQHQESYLRLHRHPRHRSRQRRGRQLRPRPQTEGPRGRGRRGKRPAGRAAGRLRLRSGRWRSAAGRCARW
jgi:FMN-dependent NADH-azoreductase